MAKTPLNDTLLQSDMDFAHFKAHNADLSEYAGANLDWNATTKQFDAESGGTTGPAGATGPTGPQGDLGEAGGALLAAFWTFNATTTAPPATGQVRSNSGNTTLW